MNNYQKSGVTLPNGGSAGAGAVERQMLARAKGILLDWDGCVAIENRIVPIAIDLIANHLEKIAIVSNNSSNVPSEFADILNQYGLVIEPERIILAGVEALNLIAQQEDARVFLLSSLIIEKYAQDLGIVLDDQNPNIVLLMRDCGFSYNKLALAANALKAGARLVVANADLSHPGSNKRIVPETGALLAALLACSGNPDMEWQLVGKPGTILFAKACAALGVAANDAVMIGDNPLTDEKGAKLAGIPSILIGEHAGLSLADLALPSLGLGAR